MPDNNLIELSLSEHTDFYPFRYALRDFADSEPMKVEDYAKRRRPKPLYSCALLNRYVLPDSSLNQLSGAEEAFRRMLGRNALSMAPAGTLRDLLRLYIYKTGLVFPLDFSYLFGIDKKYLQKFFYHGMNKGNNLVRFSGRDINYTQRHYYAYRPNMKPFCSYAIPPVIDYAGKILSKRTISHTYSIGLTEGYIRLYSLRRPCYQTEFLYEIPIGNYDYTHPGKGKIGAEVAVDSVGIVYDSHSKENNGQTPKKILLIEQDMGTEPYRILIDKLVSYSATSLFDEKSVERCCMIFSCHRILSLNKIMPPRYPVPVLTDFVLLFFFYAYKVGATNRWTDITTLDNIDILPYLRDAAFFSDREHSTFDHLLEPLYRTFREKYPIFNKIELTDIKSRINKLHETGSILEKMLLSLMGVLDAYDRINIERLLLRDIIPFLPLLEDKDTLQRLTYNRELYKTSSARHRGFANAILDNIYRRRKGRYAFDNMITFFLPIYKGFSVYTTATVLLTNQMPYILWDRNAPEIIAIENSLKAYFPTLNAFYMLSKELDLSNGKRSQAKTYEDGFPFQLRLRNCHYYRISTEPDANTDVKKGLVCVEDLTTDTGAYIRTILFARYYAGLMPVKLLLLVDNFRDAVDFFRKELTNDDTNIVSQSPRCRVDIYPSGENFSHEIRNSISFLENGNLDFANSEILFLKKSGQPYQPQKIFRLLPDNCIEFLKKLTIS